MTDDHLTRHRALLAPGTPLRDGLDRIVHGRTGGLIVLGDNEALAAVLTGGFRVDVPFSATALRELAKMDGAITLSADLSRIVWAAVQLMPAADVQTDETGTRHRTAQRVSRQTGLPVVTVSAAMATISLFLDGVRHPVSRPEPLLTRAHQAIQALSGYRDRLSESLERLSTLEVHDQVTLRDVALVAQRFEMTSRLADEVASYVIELGTDGRLVSLQLRDLTADLAGLATAIHRDYSDDQAEHHLWARLHHLPDHDLFDTVVVARSLGIGAGLHLDAPLRARGYRQLTSIPRVSLSVAGALLDHFGSLPELLGASLGDLQAVEGVTPATARTLRDGLAHIAEAGFAR